MRLASVLILIGLTVSVVVARSHGRRSQTVENGARSTNGTQESSGPQKPDKNTVLRCMMRPFGGACPRDRNGTRVWRPMQESAWRMFQGWMERMTDTAGTAA